MASTAHLLVSALASAGIVGVGDQYLALFVLGILTRVGWVQPVGAADFVGQDWFLASTALAWAITTLPSLLPPGQLGTAINALSGPVTVVSGALFAWASAGLIAGVRPELTTAMYLLTRDADWTRFSAYQGGDWAVLGGGAAVAGGLTFLKFLAKPGLAASSGTLGVSAPLFAAVETGLSLTLTPLVLFLAETNPALLTALLALLVVLLAVLLWISALALKRASRGIGKVMSLLDERPADGLAVVAEFLIWGSGFLLRGHPARGVVMLAIWAGVMTLALTVIGLLIAIPAYLLIAPRTAAALYALVAPAPLPPQRLSPPGPSSLASASR
jgi:hypothetical protein